MRLVNSSQITSVLLGFVFASFGYLLPSRAIGANGLVSLWRFEEGEGTTAHDSVGNNDGTIYGASWTTGMIGGALSFDGVDDYVDVGNDNSLKPLLPVTLSAWIRLSSSGSTEYIMALDDQTSKYYGIWWYVRSAGDLAVGYGDGGGRKIPDRRSKVGTTELEADTCYHIAAVVRGPTDMSLYIDGLEDGGTYSGSGGSLHYSSASSLIGMRHDSAYCFDGIIDDVRVYERALSDEEVWEVYQTGLPVHPRMDVWPETLVFYANEGGSNPAAQTISIRNIGAGILNYQITESCSWLEVDPNSGTSAGETDEVAVSVGISGLTGGWYDCNLTVSDPNAENSPQTVEVTLGIMVAGELHVPSEYPTIQAAIDLAAEGATVVVEPNTYTGTGNRDIDFRGKAITVRSIEPNDPNVVAATIIDCDANASDTHRGFVFLNGEGRNSIVDGFTITRGYVGRGGGIYCLDSSPTITNCTIINNTAGVDGGGIFCENGDPTLVNCTFSNNSAEGDGGGMCILMGCREISNCVIVGNTCGRYGGGIFCTLENSIKNCAISCNVAGEDGGGIYNWSGSSVISNCTIVANTAGISAGGVLNINADSPLINCILWANADSTGTGEFAQIQGPTRDVSYSCIQDDDPNDEYIPFGGEENGNIDDNPMFVRDPNDGGDGWGTGDNDDFGDSHLQNNSPCINTGDPYLPIEPNSVDIDGQPRVVGFIVDMGADEFFMWMIAVTKPEGGEVWVSGSLHEIAWESDLYEGAVDILFSKDGGSDWETVESNLPETGNYLWHLPDIVDSNQCLISVALNMPDSNVTSFNSGAFTIHPDSPSPVVVSKWKSLGGDFDRIGLSQNYGPETGCVKWKFEIDGAVPGSVTVGADNRVHIASEDGNVYTLDANGVQLWSYDTNSPLLSSPTIGPDGTVYVGSQNGKLYAIDINGNLRWTHTTDGFIYSSPAVADDGKIYVGSQDGVLHALGQDGSELWSFKIGGFGIIEGAIFASPAIGADGTIYVGGLYDPNLYAVDPNDGSVKWVCHFESGGWPFASPVVAEDGTIYQTLLYDPNLYAIDRNDGNIIWAAHLSKINHHGLDDSYSEWFEPYYYERGKCQSPDLPFMYRGAKYNVGDSGWSEPIVGPDGTVYVSLDDPYLRAVEPNEGFKWVTPLGTMGGFTLTVGSDSLIYAACDDGYLYMVDADGWDIARFDSNDRWLSFPVILEDNTIMVSDSRDNSMLISHPNNVVWAIEGDCEGEELDLYWQGGAQDLDGDGAVDYNDVALLIADWLKCSDCSKWFCVFACRPTMMFYPGDINRDLYVDFADFAALAERWLSGY